MKEESLESLNKYLFSENERLNATIDELEEEIETLKDDFDFNLGAIENIRKENHKLEDKIDKAIEYCKTMFTYGIRNNREQAEELLKILGEENE